VAAPVPVREGRLAALYTLKAARAGEIPQLPWGGSGRVRGLVRRVGLGLRVGYGAEGGGGWNEEFHGGGALEKSGIAGQRERVIVREEQASCQIAILSHTAIVISQEAHNCQIVRYQRCSSSVEVDILA
jgi:hypothetical protein